MAEEKAGAARGEPTVEDLARQIEALRADLQGLAATLKALGLAEGRAMAEGLRARVEAAKAAGAERLHGAEAAVSGMISEAEGAIRRQPALAMAVVAALGFLVGLVLARR